MWRTPPGTNAAEHIEQFLRRWRGPLTVATGYASVHGLAWLHRHTRGRSVTLIIGDLTAERFRSGTDNDRKHALAFLRRSDVKVVNWYDGSGNHPRRPMMHAKGWVVAHPRTGRPVAAMIGSANLTKNGLVRNWEMMATVADKELGRIDAQVRGLLRGGHSKTPWDVKMPLLRTIGSTKHAPHGLQGRKDKRRTEKASRGGGCLVPVAAGVATLIVVVVGAFLWL